MQGWHMVSAPHMGTIIIVLGRIPRDDHAPEVFGTVQFTKHFYPWSHGREP